MSHPSSAPATGGRRLWLVRHPRPRVPAGICYGATDVPVDPDHLQKVLPSLAAQLPHGARWRVSGLSRAQALAQALHALRPGQSPAQADPRLNEMHFGAWEMQAWDAIGAQALQAWTDDFLHHRCGGGESVNLLLARVAAAWQEWQHLNAAGDEVWFTHAGVIRAVQWLQSGAFSGAQRTLSAADWPRQHLPFGGITVCTLA